MVATHAGHLLRRMSQLVALKRRSAPPPEGPLSEVLRKRVCVVLDRPPCPQRTSRAIARAHEAYTFFPTNATDSQPPIGREPVGTDSVRYRNPVSRPKVEWGLIWTPAH